MRSHFAPGCIILLDDAQRLAERATAERWTRELDATLVIEGRERGVAVLTLPA